MKPGVSGYVSDVTEYLSRMETTKQDGTHIDNEAAMEALIDKCREIRDSGGIFFFAGNGASATMAEHMSHDCFQNAGFLTMTSSETAHITAVSNDLSYEDVFSYRISKALSGKDALVAISSSGNSPNIIKAINTARGKGMFIVTVSGMKPDNTARKLGDINFYIPAQTYGMIEAAHTVLLHCWLDLFLDKYMEGRH